eukprot:1056990-Pelagomonas_calceolata.AAC.9
MLPRASSPNLAKTKNGKAPAKALSKDPTLGNGFVNGSMEGARNMHLRVCYHCDQHNPSNMKNI